VAHAATLVADHRPRDPRLAGRGRRPFQRG